MAIRKTRAGNREARHVCLFIAAALTGLLLTASVAQAATWTVTGTGDGGGSCSGTSCPTLRDAVEAAKAGDTISLGSATYTLEKGPLSIEKNLTIAGAGPGATTITASPASRLIEVDEPELILTGVTLKGGAALPTGSKGEEGGLGGAIYNDDGTLRISDCAFTENTARAASFAQTSGSETYAEAGRGGAIYSYGQVTVADSTFSANTADGGSVAAEYVDGGEGGAIYSEGALRISSSTFAGNTAGGASAGTKYNDGGGGGAIYADEGLLSVLDSTFSGDKAGGGGTTEGGKHGGDDGFAGAIYTDGTATITGSTFSGDTAESGANGTTSDGDGGSGGAIYSDESLTLSSSTVSGDVAAGTHEGGDGGGVYSDGDAAISQSTISGNLAPSGYGGGVYNDGFLTVSQSTVSGNQTGGEGGSGEGGGIYNDGYGMQLTQSTVGPANIAGDGGGIYSDDGPSALINVTIAGNTATEEGGGIYSDAFGALANVTLFGNAAQKASGGGNLYLDYGELTLHDSLIAAGSSPTSGGNCVFESSEAFIVSKGYNAEDSNQCGLSGPGDQLNAILDLGPLQSNGGPTATVALLPGSAAIDAGDPAGCIDTEGNPLTVDQRGVARPQEARCDIGAYEYVPPPVVKSTPPPVAPVDTALKLSPSSFAPESSGASIAKAHHKKKKPAQGTTVSYTDSQAASTTFVVVEVENGLRVGKGSCKAPPKHGKRPKHAKGCTRTVTLGSFAHTDVAGANTFKFTGRLDGHGLVKGSYKLKATPKLGSLSGVTVSASFTIV